ncbi:MAG: hypothetical protein AB9819_04015 [Methanomassiliicoccales archaeon]
MDAKHEILLEQMLEELRAQTRALRELQKRMDDLERAMSQGLDDVRQTVGATDR